MAPQSLPNLAFRTEQLEKRLGTFESQLQLVTRHDERIANMADDIREIREEIRSMKRAFYTAAISVTVSALLIVGTVYTVFA